MKRRRHTPEQIVRKLIGFSLREAALLGLPVLEISEQELPSEPYEVLVAAADTCCSIHGYV
jgi:hypothetical protein